MCISFQVAAVVNCLFIARFTVVNIESNKMSFHILLLLLLLLLFVIA